MRTGGMTRATVPTIPINLRQRFVESATPAPTWLLPVCSGNRHPVDSEIDPSRTLTRRPTTGRAVVHVSRYCRRRLGEPPIFAAVSRENTLRQATPARRALSPPGAGPLRRAGSAAPAGRRSPLARGRRGRGRSAGRARSPPSAPLGTCRSAARTRTARQH
jgi:hypothetical protein